MGEYLLISDAAKQVKVESHVLRYWEEELHLPIKRNELGHRYYTKEDVERFKEIKSMKERGLQLKAIKMILKDGNWMCCREENDRKEAAAAPRMAIEIVDETVDKECQYHHRCRIDLADRRKPERGKRRLKGYSGSCSR